MNMYWKEPPWGQGIHYHLGLGFWKVKSQNYWLKNVKRITIFFISMNISYTFDYHDLKYLIYPVPVIIIFITMIQCPYMFFFLSEHVPVPGTGTCSERTVYSVPWWCSTCTCGPKSLSTVSPVGSYWTGRWGKKNTYVVRQRQRLLDRKRQRQRLQKGKDKDKAENKVHVN